MAEARSGEERVWEAGWEAHERGQRRRMAALPLSEKLKWLEGAHQLATFLLRPRQVTRSEDDEPTSRNDTP